MAGSISVSVTGSLSALADALDSQAILEAASMSGAETTLNLVSEGFKRGGDPYGQSWDAPNNLQITGRLRAYARGKASAKGWQIHSTDRKALWHHAPQPRDSWGGKSLPTRLQVPTRARGWPERWRARVTRSVNEAIKAMVR